MELATRTTRSIPRADVSIDPSARRRKCPGRRKQVGQPGRARHPLQPAGPERAGRDHPIPHDCARLGRLQVEQLVLGEPGNLHLQVDPVQQGPR